MPSIGVPRSRKVGPLVLPKFGEAIACWMSRPQSRLATSVFATKLMIASPPGEPSAIFSRPSASKTSVGAMELLGRLPPSTRFAAGPQLVLGRKS
jgi:hypothetical protein